MQEPLLKIPNRPQLLGVRVMLTTPPPWDPAILLISASLDSCTDPLGPDGPRVDAAACCCVFAARPSQATAVPFVGALINKIFGICWACCMEASDTLLHVAHGLHGSIQC
jgi:hypothetical protein